MPTTTPCGGLHLAPRRARVLSALSLALLIGLAAALPAVAAPAAALVRPQHIKVQPVLASHDFPRALPIGRSGRAGPHPIAVPGTTYYVDAQRGDDESSGLSPATALQTLAEGVSRLDPRGGDKLVLRGVFRESLRLVRINDPNTGVPDPTRPTVVQCAFDAQGRPLVARLEGGIHPAPSSFPFDRRGLPAGFGPGTGSYLDDGVAIVESSYVTISGLHVRGFAGYGMLGWRSDYLRFEYSTVEWVAWSAFWLTDQGTGSGTRHGVTIASCRINQTNLGSWYDESTGQGFNMRPEAISIVDFDGFEVYGCHLSNSMMEGIDFKEGSRNGSIHHNLVEKTRSIGIYCNEGRDTDIYRNVVRDIGYYDPQDGTGIQPAALYYSQKVPFTLSARGAAGIVVANGDLGPAETGHTSGIRVFENAVSWTMKASIAVNNEWRMEGRPGWVLDDIHIYNNVAYKACQGTTWRSSAAIVIDVGATNSSVRNNVAVSSATSGLDIWDISKGSFFATSVVSHNLLYDNRYEFVAGQSPVRADPRFVLIPSAPGQQAAFTLRAGSSAIDAGFPTGVPNGGTQTDIGAFQLGLVPWSVGPGALAH